MFGVKYDVLSMLRDVFLIVAVRAHLRGGFNGDHKLITHYTIEWHSRLFTYTHREQRERKREKVYRFRIVKSFMEILLK